jgi:hypothetical protein
LGLCVPGSQTAELGCLHYARDSLLVSEKEPTNRLLFLVFDRHPYFNK